MNDAWTEHEFKVARGLRASKPPWPYSEIAKALGRTVLAVKQKFHTEKAAEEGGHSRDRQAWRESMIPSDGADDLESRNLRFVRQLMAGGGHSRPIKFNGGVFLLGPDERPRPCPSPSCQCIASQENGCPDRQARAA